jgi:hypothetical protein
MQTLPEPERSQVGSLARGSGWTRSGLWLLQVDVPRYLKRIKLHKVDNAGVTVLALAVYQKVNSKLTQHLAIPPKR